MPLYGADTTAPAEPSPFPSTSISLYYPETNLRRDELASAAELGRMKTSRPVLLPTLALLISGQRRF